MTIIGQDWIAPQPPEQIVGQGIGTLGLARFGSRDQSAARCRFWQPTQLEEMKNGLPREGQCWTEAKTKKALSYTCLNKTNDTNIYHFPEHVSFNLIFFMNSNWPSYNLFKLETFQDVLLLCVFFYERKITFVLFCFLLS